MCHAVSSRIQLSLLQLLSVFLIRLMMMMMMMMALSFVVFFLPHVSRRGCLVCW